MQKQSAKCRRMGYRMDRLRRAIFHAKFNKVKRRDQRNIQEGNYTIDELIDMGRKQNRMEIAKDMTMNKRQNRKGAFN